MDPVIETKRLILRRPVESDLNDWATFMADDVATRYLGGRQARSVAWRGMATVAGSWALRGHGMFSVIERASGRWIGRIGPWNPEGWPGTEVGWGVIRDVWGRGYGYEGATAAMEWAFNVLRWQEIIHCIDPENAPSAALAAKLGSTNHGPGQMPAPYASGRVDIWRQTHDAWKKRIATEA